MKRILIAVLLALSVCTWAEEDFLLDQDFFEDDLLLEAPALEEPPSLGLDLFELEALTVSGSMDNRIGLGYSRREWDSNGDYSVLPQLEYGLRFDGRPNEKFRIYGSFEIGYPFEEELESGEIIERSLEVEELFSDLNLGDRLFIRTGKQRIGWGTGYFFNPIDVISQEAIDYNDPTAPREGPMALGLRYPLGVHQLNLHVITQGSGELEDLQFAPRIDLLLGDYEASLYGHFQYDQTFRTMASITGPVPGIRGCTIFGEGILMDRSEKTLVNEDLGSYEINHWIFSGTAGLRYQNSRNSWADIMAIGQYYYNAEGYDRENPFQGQALMLLATETLNLEDLSDPGRHYSGAYLRLGNLWESSFTLSCNWIANWTDQSGWVDPRLSWQPKEQKLAALGIELGSRLYYGEKNSQFRGSEETMRTMDLYLNFRLGTGEF